VSSGLEPDRIDEDAAAVMEPGFEPFLEPAIEHGGADVAAVADIRVEDARARDVRVDDPWADRAGTSGQRRTIVITGRPAERQLPRRRGWEASLPLHERSGFKPDRVALWAVLLGLILLLVAAASSHAAILVH
jgi:hypothetical protein